MKEVADEAAALSPSVEHVLVFRRIGRPVAWTEGRDRWWHEALAAASAACETERTSPEDPFMIIYTSGTTGRPKGALHTHDGFPLKGAQDLAHCFDVQPDDVVFWFTDMGWMMGPWLFCATLTLGASVFCYEGSPDYPGPDRVWDMVERHRVTVLGISPTAIRGLMRFGEGPVQQHDLSSLRVLGSTGEPWNPEPWRWYFEQVGGGRCPIINYVGGTEISGGYLGCTTIHPLKPCSFSVPIAGMAIDVVDEAGRSVRGEVGELVIRAPWPGMTRGFWQDRQRYLETYWSRFPDTWVHGDWAYLDEDGFWFIQGRSDDTIKVAGKRLGPAEVESVVVAHPSVSEAAAIGVPHPLKGEGVVIFAIPRPGCEPTDGLRSEIEALVVQQLGRPLRPEAVKFVRDLPKTRNAKIMRRVIRARYLDRDLGDVSGLENPAAVEEIARAT
jgi:acetyl-CoA synthetase